MLNNTRTNRCIMDVKNALFELGVLDQTELNNELDLNQDLRKDLGLDSQELMTLFDLVSSLAISEPLVGLTHIHKLSDLVNYLIQHRNKWLYTDVPFVVQANTIIEQDVDTVFDYIKDYEKWPDILKHVIKIEKVVDDDRLQSFKMHIAEFETKQQYSVQTWRYVNEQYRIIDFSQTVPPAGFSCHKGGWRFLESSNGCTRLISYHGFALYNLSQLEEAFALIRKHMHLALNTWASFANGAKHE